MSQKQVVTTVGCIEKKINFPNKAVHIIMQSSAFSEKNGILVFVVTINTNDTQYILCNTNWKDHAAW